LPDPRALLAAEVEVLELEVELETRRRDRLAGVAPPGARRALFAHEIRAETNFAAVEAELDDAVRRHLARLRADRARYLELLLADLRQRGSADAIADRLLQLDGPTPGPPVPGVAGLVRQAEKFHLGAARATREAAAARVRAEAVAQGVDVPADPPKRSEVDEAALKVHARRLATGPIADLNRALREHIFALPLHTDRPVRLAEPTPEQLLQSLESHARDLSDAPLEDYARTGSTAAYGAGRQAGARDLPKPARIYASELLDGNTCGPCSIVDGKEYATVEESLEDYPTGRYRFCEGGPRCRGTRVFVWETEALPTEAVPGDRPLPGAGTPGGPPLPSPPKEPRLPSGQLRPDLPPDHPIFQVSEGPAKVTDPDVIDASGRIVNKARDAEPGISSAMREFADASGGELDGFAFRLKVDPGWQNAAQMERSTERIRQKIAESLADARAQGLGLDAAYFEARYADAVRYTVNFSREGYVRGAAELGDALGSRFELLKWKNT
jgi:hypothetical protein